MAANLDIDTLTEIIHECCRERDLWDRISAEDLRFNEGKAKGLAEAEAAGWAEGEAKGRLQEKRSNALGMLEAGMGLEQISKIIRLSLEETESLLRS